MSVSRTTPKRLERSPSRPEIRDVTILALSFGASAVPYLTGLGYYSDDYRLFSAMAFSEPQTFWGAYGELIEDPNVVTRPVQALYVALLYVVCGLSPTPGHVLNHLILLTGGILFYLSLRSVSVSRFYALVLPLLFLSLPHYSTIRFWLATYHASIACMFFFLALYCCVRSARHASKRPRLWFVASLASMLISLFAYETFLPLFFLMPFVAFSPRLLALQKLRDWRPDDSEWPTRLAIQFAAITLLVVVTGQIKVARFGSENLWEGGFDQWIRFVGWMAKGVAWSSFWENGVKLPVNLVILIRNHWSIQTFAPSVVILCVLAVYLRKLPRPEGGSWVFKVAVLFALGLVILAGSYAVFLNTFRIGFSPTGIANRVAITSTVGIAVMAGSLFLLADRFSRKAWKRIVTPFLAAAICASGSFVNATLGVMWVEAFGVQTRILADIRDDLPELPPHTAVLLDGMCPFVGPAPVFESSWDLRGALRMMYGDETLRADVIKPGIRLERESLVTRIYEMQERYRYEHILIYNAELRRAYEISDRDSAESYFSEFDPEETARCNFTDGGGVNVYRLGAPRGP